MNLIIGAIAQLLHVALMAAAAPTLVGIIGWMQARCSGRVGPSVIQPWRDLSKLWRKQTIIAESASDVTALAPLAGAAATAVAACLVPSFALGMTLAPFADVVLIAGLLVLARCSLALAAMDAGVAIAGMAASRVMLLACMSEPALLLVGFVLALLAGSANLDIIAGMQLEADWRIPVILLLAAVLPAAFIDSALPDMALKEDLSGGELALVKATAALRLLVWFDLLGAMFVPFGMAPSGVTPLAWPLGLACWLARTLVLAALLVLVRVVFGRVRLIHAVKMLRVSVLLALLAAAFVFAGMGTA